MQTTELTIWLDEKQARDLVRKHGAPLFVYSKDRLETTAQDLLDLDLPFGHTVRYAVKANPHPEIIQTYDSLGLHFDASSVYEAKQLIDNGVDPKKISLCSQTLSGPLAKVLEAGVLPTATSLRQMQTLADHGAGELAVRINPGFGSGHSNRTNVGGPASSFGIWHEYLDDVKDLAKKHGVKITRLHTHIGSGADPGVWDKAISMSLGIAEQLPDAVTLDIGGGYKIARVAGEKGTDMKEVASVFARRLEEFHQRTGRKLHLEMEPGTYLVANAGILLAEVEDIVDTGESGYRFIKVGTGMNDILRPSLYGAQHEIAVLNDSHDTEDYVVVGHNCESGDILTPAPGDPEGILPRKLTKSEVGDLVAIGGTGAYCASMRASGYNAFPEAREVMV